MKILICTIIRNQEHNLVTWYNQIKSIVQLNEDIEFSLSVYENNSTDSTKKIISGLDFSFILKKNIVCEDLDNTEFFKGGYEPYGEESKRRVKILSECRNKCLNVDLLSDSNFVLFVEPDVRFNPIIFRDLYNFILKNKYDVVSAISRSNNVHYDAWGTRINIGDTWADLTKVINTNQKIDLYSTFNCFVLYNSEPFIKHNCRFKYMSEVLKTHDCDTVLICEEFRKYGYNKICMLPNKIVQHYF